MRKFFNTAGYCRPDWHYMVPPLPRLPNAQRLVDQNAYFVVHAPRQTGKTTTLIAFAKQLTAVGTYAALYFTVEAAKVAIDDVGMAEAIILSQIRDAALSLPEELRPPPWPDAAQGARILTALRVWARACPRPLVLVFDEIDALRGESLVSVLSQLRSGYFGDRPREFPASVILCGLRDVRDYKIASGGNPNRAGSSSPFNVKVASFKLGNFVQEQVEALYKLHTTETGQVFTDDAIARAFDLTGGQPWLVNALAYEIVDNMAVPITETITLNHVEQAKERLILARATHLDSLVARLMEPRVKRVLEPILAGMLNEEIDETYNDDVHYCRDLGLTTPKPIRIANPIYREVIVRVLGSYVEDQVFIEPRSFILPDGTLDMPRMLDEFAAFWIENGDVLVHGYSKAYHESAPQLVFMAYLQRVVNGGGFIDREYGIGRGRIDLLVRWPYKDAEGKRIVQREAIELKIWREKQTDPLAQGLKQLDDYLAKTGLETGVLIIFDRRKGAKSIEKRTRFKKVKTLSKKTVTLLRA